LSRFKIWRTPCKLLAYPQRYAYPRLRIAALKDQKVAFLNLDT
jgi:hypothetical protein